MLLPFLHLLFKSGGNLQSTMTLWKVGSMEVGLANSLLWLLYSTVVLPRDNAYDTILVNAWSAAVNLSFLLVMYAREQKKTRAKYALGGSLIVIAVCLIIFQKPISSNVFTEIGFGGAGLAALARTHWLQIKDLISNYVKLIVNCNLIIWYHLNEVISCVSGSQGSRES